ncbi:hypothetical protein [Streptomyces violascens]|uniref:hypothetical protein n=1 Tax=Streptomyces violascens TaxID=67381 RepID=UPI0036610ADF
MHRTALRGQAGRTVCRLPEFKKKAARPDAFALFHDTSRPTIHPDGYRRLHLASLGSTRITQSSKRLVRLVDRGPARINR